jgi:A/G-specific adenine glycosylase
MAPSVPLQPVQLAKFRRALLRWYEKNRRDLPWRRSSDPYRIWVSEIMLQQTRVAAVLLRYEQFLQRFPDVRKLANAREASVLAEWSGLGYYRRARNLHAASKAIVLEQGCEFPRNAEQWRSLPGIGKYTAAAIASIAFSEPVAVLDGNVERVLRRLLGASQSNIALWAAADALLDRKRPGDFNQAMMELGALICLPSQPKCAECPVAKFCRTRGRGRPRLRKPRQIKREVFYLLEQRAGSVLMVKRFADEKLMPGMWELPQVQADVREPLFSLKHAITVTDFTVHVVPGSADSVRGNWVQVWRLKSLPLTGLTRKILRRAGVIKQDETSNEKKRGRHDVAE